MDDSGDEEDEARKDKRRTGTDGEEDAGGNDGGWGWTEKVGNPQNGHGGEEKKVDEDRKTKAVL